MISTAIRRLLFVLLLTLGGPALAVQPDEVLEDPALEARARTLSAEVRCLVCQNQSIDDSNADLARDLRIIVRERLVAGDSNAEVKRYLVDRYGDYVLLTPPMALGTILLWVGPFVFVALGAVAVFVWFRGRSVATAGPRMAESAGLSAEERRRIDSLLAEDSPPGGDGKGEGGRG